MCFFLALPDPGLPILHNTFQIDVEANIIDKGHTVSATLYFDNPNNRAAISYFANGKDGKIIFNYQQDEVYNISGLEPVLTFILGTILFSVK